MTFRDNTFITADGLHYEGVLRDVDKSRLSLQPIFEAFTNSLEAIKSQKILDFAGEIKITATQLTDGSPEFKSLTIEDNGIGFNENEFKRFNTYKDFTKGFKNLGSGRIQYAHYFDTTTIESVFNENGQFYKREFIVSKSVEFLKKNAITFLKKTKPITETKTGTKIIFSDLLDKSGRIYHNLNQLILKEELIRRYLQYFCYNKSVLPSIKIEYYLWEELKGTTTINEDDIPNVNNTKIVNLNYSKIADNGIEIIKTKKEEAFTIDAFRIKKTLLKGNDLKVTSKSEIVEGFELELKFIAKDDDFEDDQFLFLVSSEYIDRRDTNTRGKLNIPNKESFSKNTSLFGHEEILFEDIQEGINQSIILMYPEIQKAKEKHEIQFEELKKMFFLDDKSIEELSISLNDSENKILEKFYTAEAKKSAALDANIKTRIDKLKALNTDSEDYNRLLQEEIEQLVKEIPLQNRTALTHYVARRKLVLELMDKILKRQLDIQNNGSSNIDEKLLHRLIFQQSSDNTSKSDLWLFNEEFIYFNGVSESKLKDVKINDELIFKDEFEEVEINYLRSLGENRQIKRPDILLFPDESKCIIIEFKNPNVSVREHLGQIDFYAGLIRNFTKESFNLDTFYGYLIGQAIEPADVRITDQRFIHSYHLDYLYRPSTPVAGDIFPNIKKNDGSIYTEVIKYTTLLERATIRNKIFIDKLTNL